jgi:hypothetical protein
MQSYIIQIIGWMHLSHSYLLALYPYIINNFTYDIMYINYFNCIMISYTFLNGECPICYFCKLIVMNDYKGGQDITNYIDIYSVIENKFHANFYLATMTTFYIISLFRVIERVNIREIKWLCQCNFIVLSVYFLFIRKIINSTIYENYFIFYQEYCRIILFVTNTLINIITIQYLHVVSHEKTN